MSEEVTLAVATENTLDTENTSDNRLVKEITKPQMTQKLADDYIRKESLSDVKSELRKFNEEMELNFQYFAIFMGLVNRKL